MYLTGMGPVMNEPATGAGRSLTRLSQTLIVPTVMMGGFNAVSFSGLSPGFIGLYQINAAVPAAVASGILQLNVQANGVTSNTATISVK